MKFSILTRHVLLLGMLSSQALATSDFQWTFSANGFASYRLTSVSSTLVYPGSLPVDDPTLNLILGKRYGVTNLNPSVHPLQIIAMGGGDAILLSEGAVTGSLEGDAGIDWTDNGSGLIEFTATQALFDALTASGSTPGYRCAIHTSTMRGTFQLFGNGVAIANPIVDVIPKGAITISLQPVMTGLSSPLGLVQPDDGTDRLFIYDQIGKIWIVENGLPLTTPFLDISASLSLSPGFDERGLLGLAFHPGFSSNGKVYAYYSDPTTNTLADFTFSGSAPANHQAVIAEWQVDALNANLLDPATERVLLRIDEPQFNHDGGAIRFGPDGFLYIALGDGGQADDEGDGHVAGGNGQDKDNVYGAILRIDVEGGNSANGQYGIPAGNPFVGGAGLDEIWAYGFRNPYSMTFDTSTGDLYVADVGQNDIEEVDLVIGGGNFGWRLKEGSFFFDANGAGDGFVTTVPTEPPPTGLIDPIAEYDHDDGTAIVGGSVYRGALLPALTGRYLAGDFGTSFGTPSGRLFYVEGGEFLELRINREDRPLGLWLKGFGRDRAGEMYVCGSTTLGPTGATGVVLKMIPLPPLTAVRNSWTLYR